MGTWGNVLISHLLLVIPMSYTCHHVTKTHTHTTDRPPPPPPNTQTHTTDRPPPPPPHTICIYFIGIVINDLHESEWHCLLYVLFSEYLTTIHVIHHKSFKQLDQSQPCSQASAWHAASSPHMLTHRYSDQDDCRQRNHSYKCRPMPCSMLLGNPDDYSEPANMGSNATRADQRGKHSDPVSL